MRQVTCRECARIYDYDQDDTCPKCGSYNPPAGAGATELESQLLSRFDSNRARQGAAAAIKPSVKATMGAGADPFAPRSAGAPPRLAPHLCVSPREDERLPKVNFTPFFLLVAVAVVVLAVVLLPVLSNLISMPPQPETSFFATGESFPLGKLTVTVDDCRWLEVSEENRLHREGFDILLVELYAEGGESYKKTDPVGSTYLQLDEGMCYPETNPLDKSRLQELGLQPVDLTSVLWEDPLLGELVFYIPEDTTSAMLVLDELRAGKDTPVATRYVELALPNK